MILYDNILHHIFGLLVSSISGNSCDRCEWYPKVKVVNILGDQLSMRAEKEFYWWSDKDYNNNNNNNNNTSEEPENSSRQNSIAETSSKE